MDLGIAGRTALVTASSKGLGRASALALAAEGVKVAICARGEEALRATERDIKDAGGTVWATVDDVTQPDAVLWELRGVVEQEIEVSELPLSVDSSIGFVVAPEDGNDVNDLVQRADVAMYAAACALLVGSPPIPISPSG